MSGQCQYVSLQFHVAAVIFRLLGTWFSKVVQFRGPFRTKNPKLSQANGQYENCSHFWDIFWFFWKGLNKCSKIHLTYVPIVKYNESECDIQNSNLLYKTHQTCQNTFEILESIGKTNKKAKILLYYMYNLHNSYFDFFGRFVSFVILGFLYFQTSGYKKRTTHHK